MIAALVSGKISLHFDCLEKWGQLGGVSYFESKAFTITKGGGLLLDKNLTQKDLTVLIPLRYNRRIFFPDFDIPCPFKIKF